MFLLLFFFSKAWRKVANDNVQGGGECVQEKDRCPSEKSCFWDLLWWQKRRRRRSALCPIQIATTSIKSIVIYICSICKKLFSSLSLPHILGTFWHFFFRENHGKILKSAKQRMISNILWRWRQVCPSFLDGYFITILLLLLLNTILYKKKNARPRDPCAYPPMGQPNDH